MPTYLEDDPHPQALDDNFDQGDLHPGVAPRPICSKSLKREGREVEQTHPDNLILFDKCAASVVADTLKWNKGQWLAPVFKQTSEDGGGHIGIGRHQETTTSSSASNANDQDDSR